MGLGVHNIFRHSLKSIKIPQVLEFFKSTHLEVLDFPAMAYPGLNLPESKFTYINDYQMLDSFHMEIPWS